MEAKQDKLTAGCRQLTSAEITTLLTGWNTAPNADSNDGFIEIAPAWIGSSNTSIPRRLTIFYNRVGNTTKGITIKLGEKEFTIGIIDALNRQYVEISLDG